MTNRRRNFLGGCWGIVMGLIVLAALTGCGGVSIPPILSDCRVGASAPPGAGYSCKADPRGLGYPWTWQKDGEPVPVPTPSPTPSPATKCDDPNALPCATGTHCNKAGACVPDRPWPANPRYCGAEPFPTCDCYQTSSARANLCTYVWCDGEMAQATCPNAPPPPPPPPTCEDKPPVCTTVVERVCEDNDGNVLGVFDPKAQSGPTACWTVKDWVSYMKNHNWKAADGTLRVINGVEVGVNLGGSHGNAQDQCTRTDDGWLVRCDDPNARIRWAVDPPRVVQKSVETCTPGIKCDDPPPPPPLPLVGCTPLSHIGVALHNTVPAPNGPRKIAWRFSATNKSVKPYCPDARNECEQQGYSVNADGSFTFHFEERFRCQAPTPPVWSQQEPHTGDRWEPTDVNSENPWLANLKPAVQGKHTVRVCVPDAKGNQTNNCRTTTAVAP